MAVEIQNCQMAIALVLSYNMLAEEAMWTRTASFQILVEAGEPIAGQVILVLRLFPVIDATVFPLLLSLVWNVIRSRCHVTPLFLCAVNAFFPRPLKELIWVGFVTNVLLFLYAEVNQTWLPGLLLAMLRVTAL